LIIYQIHFSAVFMLKCYELSPPEATLMKLNHRQLEAFRAMIETGSVTEASKRIGVTQPAASRLISDLEYAIGYALFLREKKRLTPTPEAMALFEEVDRSYIGLGLIGDAARDIGANRRGALRIVSLPAMALSFLPHVISKFCEDKPDISVDMQIHSSQRVIQCVASQQFDLGFAEIDSLHPAVNSQVFFESPMVAILPKHHPLCHKATLTPQDFANENFIALGSSYAMRKRIDALFLANNITRKMQIETQLSMAVANLVASGAGVSIIEALTASSFRGLDLVETRPFLPEITYTYRVLSPAHRPISLLTESFMRATRDALMKFDVSGQAF
jgi:DNA-binding transcriptional LysR family regulator